MTVRTRRGACRRNATLESLLRQNNVSADLTASVITAVRGVFNPRDLRASETYVFRRTLDGLFREFRYPDRPDRLLRVVFKTQPSSAAEPAVDVEVVAVPKEIEMTAVDASITKAHPSLVGAFDASGENIQLALALAEIFGGEVDFNSDLQPGDRIQVLFERATRDGEFVGYGDVKAAVLVARAAASSRRFRYRRRRRQDRRGTTRRAGRSSGSS